MLSRHFAPLEGSEGGRSFAPIVPQNMSSALYLAGSRSDFCMQLGVRAAT